MQTQPDFAAKDLLPLMIDDMAMALSERDDEPVEQQRTRYKLTLNMILRLAPRDVVETMLAGHCVMFHTLMIDSLREGLRGPDKMLSRAARAEIAAMDKAFGNNLQRLARYRASQAEAPARRRAEKPNAAAARPEAAPVPMSATAASPTDAAAVPAATPPGSPPAAGVAPEATGLPPPTAASPADAVAATEIRLELASDDADDAEDMVDTRIQVAPHVMQEWFANPAVMAALAARDPEALAGALKVEMTPEALLAAAAGLASRPPDRPDGAVGIDAMAACARDGP